MNAEETVKVAVKDLTRLRVTCVKCRSVAEMPVDRLLKTLGDIRCPGCEAVLRAGAGGSGVPDAFDKLAQALSGLSNLPVGKVEFVLTQPAKP